MAEKQLRPAVKFYFLGLVFRSHLMLGSLRESTVCNLICSRCGRTFPRSDSRENTDSFCFRDRTAKILYGATLLRWLRYFNHFGRRRARSGIKDFAIRKRRQVQVLLKYSEHDYMIACFVVIHVQPTMPSRLVHLFGSNDLLLKFPLLQLMQNSVNFTVEIGLHKFYVLFTIGSCCNSMLLFTPCLFTQAKR